MTSGEHSQTRSISAREYLRVSLDKSGQARSVTEQHDDNRQAAEREGWTLGEPYQDVSVSASRYSTKARKGYDALTRELERGRFGADVLVLWESSRGSRRVSEWVALIELCEQAGVKIAVTTHGPRTYDPANARDRRSLLEDSVDSEYESSKIRDRVARAMARNAAEGRPHGHCPYGYVRKYDPATGKLAAQEIEPTEAAVIRELYDRLHKGHSLRSIAVDFDKRGVRTRSGKAWTAAHLRAIAVKPLYAGLRAHAPGTTSHNHGPHATVVEGSWQAVVPRALWQAVVDKLRAPERRTSRPGRGKHLLSMIAVCGVCGGPMAATNRKSYASQQPPPPQYQCHQRGHVRVTKSELDHLAETAICEYLAREDVHDALTASTTDEDALAAVRDELAVARARRDELADALAAGTVSVQLAARSEPKIAASIATLEARERELTTPPALSGLITPGKDVKRRWKEMPMSAKREVAKLLLAPGMLGQLRVTRSPSPGHRVHAADRVVWGRRE